MNEWMIAAKRPRLHLCVFLSTNHPNMLCVCPLLSRIYLALLCSPPSATTLHLWQFDGSIWTCLWSHVAVEPWDWWGQQQEGQTLCCSGPNIVNMQAREGKTRDHVISVMHACFHTDLTSILSTLRWGLHTQRRCRQRLYPQTGAPDGRRLVAAGGGEKGFFKVLPESLSAPQTLDLQVQPIHPHCIWTQWKGKDHELMKLNLKCHSDLELEVQLEVMKTIWCFGSKHVTENSAKNKNLLKLLSNGDWSVMLRNTQLVIWHHLD